MGRARMRAERVRAKKMTPGLGIADVEQPLRIREVRLAQCPVVLVELVEREVSGGPSAGPARHRRRPPAAATLRTAPRRGCAGQKRDHRHGRARTEHVGRPGRIRRPCCTPARATPRSARPWSRRPAARGELKRAVLEERQRPGDIPGAAGCQVEEAPEEIDPLGGIRRRAGVAGLFEEADRHGVLSCRSCQAAETAWPVGWAWLRLLQVSPRPLPAWAKTSARLHLYMVGLA